MYVGLKCTSLIEMEIWKEDKDICIAGALDTWMEYEALEKARFMSLSATI